MGLSQSPNFYHPPYQIHCFHNNRYRKRLVMFATYTNVHVSRFSATDTVGTFSVWHNPNVTHMWPITRPRPLSSWPIELPHLRFRWNFCCFFSPRCGSFYQVCSDLKSLAFFFNFCFVLLWCFVAYSQGHWRLVWLSRNWEQFFRFIDEKVIASFMRLTAFDSSLCKLFSRTWYLFIQNFVFYPSLVHERAIFFQFQRNRMQNSVWIGCYCEATSWKFGEQ